MKQAAEIVCLLLEFGPGDRLGSEDRLPRDRATRRRIVPIAG
jgi:hypothetical protein